MEYKGDSPHFYNHNEIHSKFKNIRKLMKVLKTNEIRILIGWAWSRDIASFFHFYVIYYSDDEKS